MAESSTWTPAELALRFRVRQAWLPRCAVCGARVRRGVGACANCEASRTPNTEAPSRRACPPLAGTAPAPERILTNGAGRTHKPKPCAEISCGKMFTPTGGRSKYCEDCR